MRHVSHSSARLVSSTAFVCVSATPTLRFFSIAGGGRGDLFKRNASQYRTPYAGSARGITDPSQSTKPQDGQLHTRKRRSHVALDRAYSGGAHHRPTIASWSYLLPSLRESVEAACPASLYEKLAAGEEAVSPQEQEQLVAAQRLFRFELQQRIGLLEDSLAEAELPYLIQWPSLFQRAWLQLPLSSSHTAEVKSGVADAVATVPASEAAGAPCSVVAWASSSASSSSSNTSPDNASFSSRLQLLTRHVVDCVDQELTQLESGGPAREDGAPRSRRQEALEAAWRAQWQSAVQWHEKNAK